ncbi:hypothetical protein [Eudoraea chungangensis]|uniref:hypothetical protein n=1 Tax=Eudoraea chungangensis TaxID=1481905 RepID=UPI0023EB3004|nr:hypothetical protein [Eudoraea chungangensis]
MNKRIFVACILALTGLGLTAQSKKDLMAEVNNLQSELEATKTELVEAKKNAKVSEAQAASYESQLAEVQANNATLLTNLNNFTEQSNQKLDNLSGVMETLRKKEEELKFINESLTSNDSISLIVLTNFKQTLGESANIGVEKGAITVIMPYSSLFDGNGNTTKLKGNADETIAKIASVLKSNPQMIMSIENQTAETSSYASVLAQSGSLITAFGETHAIPSDRMILTRTTNPSNTIRFKIHPDFNSFYLQLRQNMKK